LPTEFYGGPGGTPNYYTGSRYAGKFEIYTVTDGSISYQDHEVDHDYLYYDATFTATFDSPPALMSGGEEYELHATTSGSGHVSQYAGGGNSFITFQYWNEGGVLSGDTSAGTNLDFVEDTATCFYTPPTASVGGQLSLTASLWNCSACNVQWLYTAREVEVIDALLEQTQKKPMNLVQLKRYFDVEPTLPDAINTIKILSGLTQGDDARRFGDITGDGKAGIDDLIYFLQSLAQ
jgi:hypothetical protein